MTQTGRTAMRLLGVGLRGVWSLAAGNKLCFVTAKPLRRVAQATVEIVTAGRARTSAG